MVCDTTEEKGKNPHKKYHCQHRRYKYTCKGCGDNGKRTNVWNVVVVTFVCMPNRNSTVWIVMVVPFVNMAN